MKNNRIKVLHIKWKLSSDGATVIVLNWAKQLKEHVQVDWLLTSVGESDWKWKFEELGSEIFEIQENYSKRIDKVLKNANAFVRFFKENDYQIIHVDTDSLRRYNILLYAFLAGIPCRIVHSHNSGNDDRYQLLKYEFGRKLYRKLMGAFATDFIACSKEAAYWLFPAKKASEAIILKNGININQFQFDCEKRKQIRNQLGVQNDFLIGIVGRLTKQKNHEFLIDVFKQVNEKEKNTKLMLIGDGELRDKIEKQIDRLDLRNNIILTGAIENVEDYLCAMDLFVLPSIYEGLGIVNIEAQANGLYCVVSDGVVKETKITNNIEYLELKNDLWVDRILSNLRQAKIIHRESMGNEVRSAGYDISSSAEVLLNVYRKANERFGGTDESR